MVEFKIGYIGENSDIVYQCAVEYFKEKNLADKDFSIVLEDISNSSPEEIEANTYQLVMFDTKILDTDMVNIIKELKNSRSDITDINFLPYARKAITQEQIVENSSKISEILGKEVYSIPVNVSDLKDINGYLDAMYISSIEYKEVANGVFLEKQEIQNEIARQVLDVLKRKDEVTYDHVASVGKITGVFAEYLGFDQEMVKSMEYVAMVHDTGKIAIPTNVLKAGLTLGNEVQQMNPHDELGANILRNKNILNEEEMKGVHGHHGKDAVEDNDYSNIITLIDSFDAMTSQRGYNSPKNIVQALEEVMKFSEPNLKGFTQFRDKEICEKFVAYNIIEIGKMGYDMKAMFEDMLPGKIALNDKAQKSDSANWKFATSSSLEAIKKILDVCEKYKDEIVIENPPTKTVTNLGYSLDENGRLNYVDKSLSHDYNIRVQSEFEFQVRKMYQDNYPDVLKETKTISELIDKYLEKEGVKNKEDSEIWANAVGITDSTDKQGKHFMEIGRQARQVEEQSIETDIEPKNEPMENTERRINLGLEIKEAAPKDTNYNIQNTKNVGKAINEMNREVKNQSQNMELEGK